MELKQITKKIFDIPSTENGGIDALNGFEFQVSSAIYLIFENYKETSEFELIYEKLEDFIIINHKINLYQSKGVSFNITPNQLVKNRSKTANNQSIIEKMYDNYLKIHESFSNINVETNLIICENTTFSKNLWDTDLIYDKEASKVYFEDFSPECKSLILDSTRHPHYDWKVIRGRKFIPKSRHEEVTRTYMEDTITEKNGENKINSRALYYALVYEINRIRKNKSSISGNFIDRKLSEFMKPDNDIHFNRVNFLLNDDDKKSIPLKRSFDEFKITYKVINHPVRNDYYDLLSVYNGTDNDIYDFMNTIETHPSTKEITFRYKDKELLALALLVICNEEDYK